MDEFVINRADEYGRSIYLRDRPPGSRSVIFTGAPGTGKSFTLRHAAEQARNNGHLVIKIDASSRESVQSRMTRAIGDQLDQLKDQTPFGAGQLVRRLRKTLDTMLSNRFDIQNAISGSISWWSPLRIAFTHARDQQFERPTSSVNDLADRLGDIAGDRGRQVILLIDNLDRAQESDLATINELAVHLERGDGPVNLAVAASQPTLDKLLVAATPEGLAAGAARCYDVRTCGPVPDNELRPALTARIARSGNAVVAEAADQLVTEANGDPGRLLRLADQATELADGAHGVTADTAATAITRLRHDDAWIYNAGWNNLTGRAKTILADASSQPGGSKVTDLNAGLDDADEWAERDAARAELIGAGMVRESDGRLIVADPGMQQWVAEHTGAPLSLRPSSGADKAQQTGSGKSTRATTGQTANKTAGQAANGVAATKVSKSSAVKKSTSPSPTKTPAKSPAKSTTTKGTAKATTGKASTAKASTAKASTAKTSTAKKSTSKTAGAKKSVTKTNTSKRTTAAKSPRPTIDLNSGQPAAARAVTARRAILRPVGDPVGRAS